MQLIGRRVSIAFAVVSALALATPVWAQTPKPDEHRDHHPPGAAPTPGTPPASGAPAAPGVNVPGGLRGMMGMTGMMPMMQGMMSGMQDGLPVMMLHHTEGTLAFLKTELQITAAQEPLWVAFADAMREVAKKAQERPAAPQPNASIPERLAAREKALESQVELLKRYRPATAELYAGLTPEQRKKANALAGMGMGIGL